MKTLLIHDLSPADFASLGLDPSGDITVISDNGTIRHCVGCFGCWIKTPGTCVLQDGYQTMGHLLSECDDLVIVSRCVYGSYSPFVRNVLDRSISYVLPYFVTINGETHHAKRYEHDISLAVHFYGDDITDAERATARALVKANSINLHCSVRNVCFHETPHELGEALR